MNEPKTIDLTIPYQQEDSWLNSPWQSMLENESEYLYRKYINDYHDRYNTLKESEVLLAIQHIYPDITLTAIKSSSKIQSEFENLEYPSKWEFAYKGEVLVSIERVHGNPQAGLITRRYY